MGVDSLNKERRITRDHHLVTFCFDFFLDFCWDLIKEATDLSPKQPNGPSLYEQV